MISQSIRFFVMLFKGLIFYYNCVKNSVRIFYIQYFLNFRLKFFGQGLRSVVIIYIFRERVREEFGLRILIFVNRERIFFRYLSKFSFWNIFIIKLLFGVNILRYIFSVSFIRYMVRGIFIVGVSFMFGVISDMIIWILLSLTRFSSVFIISLLRKSF